MKTENIHTRLLVFFVTLSTILSFSVPALAIDDGARVYWKGREGTNVVSFQSLRVDMDASKTLQFGPGSYIYPNADVEASLFIANWVHHFTWLDRPSSFNFALAGGDVDVDLTTTGVPTQFLPPGAGASTLFSESSSGFADPTVQFVTNLFGAPPLRSNVDLLNYEPTWTLDAAAMLAFPVGEYDEDKLVNIGQNRWFGRFALPFTYHFGAFTRGTGRALR